MASALGRLRTTGVEVGALGLVPQMKDERQSETGQGNEEIKERKTRSKQP